MEMVRRLIMEYKSRIGEKIYKGQLLFQPQIKWDCWLSFFYNWQPVSMLILDENLNKAEIKIWTTIEEEAETELNRFLHFRG